MESNFLTISFSQLRQQLGNQRELTERSVRKLCKNIMGKDITDPAVYYSSGKIYVVDSRNMTFEQTLDSIERHYREING